MAEGEDAAQKIISTFTSQIVSGMSLPVKRTNGSPGRCILNMDEETTKLNLKIGSYTCDVQLDDIGQITIGEEQPDGLNFPINELSVTLALWTGEGFSFEFKDNESRDTFALCLGMFVDQRRQNWDEDDDWGEEGEAIHSAHDYKTDDFWKPAWCHSCNEFLKGWSEQGQICSRCRRVVCHSCAKHDDKCPGVAVANPKGDDCDAVGRGTYAPYFETPGTVPVESARSTQPHAGAPADAKDDGLNAGQKIVKRFVQTMVRGRHLQMLSKVGGSLECLVHFDRELKNIFIQRAGNKEAKKKGILLKNVQEICVGTAVAMEVELPVNERSVTLMLAEGQAVAFRFENDEDRDTFALCLGMLVDGNRKEKEKKKPKQK